MVFWIALIRRGLPWWDARLCYNELVENRRRASSMLYTAAARGTAATVTPSTEPSPSLSIFYVTPDAMIESECPDSSRTPAIHDKQFCGALRFKGSK
jgi:hypothetical protein